MKITLYECREDENDGIRLIHLQMLLKRIFGVVASNSTVCFDYYGTFVHIFSSNLRIQNNGMNGMNRYKTYGMNRYKTIR